MPSRRLSRLGPALGLSRSDMPGRLVTARPPLKRSTRAELARDTVEIVERGSYRSASGRVVDIAHPIRDCLEATRYYLPEELERLRGDVLGRPGNDHSAVFEVVNETTLSGIARVLSLGQ